MTGVWLALACTVVLWPAGRSPRPARRHRPRRRTTRRRGLAAVAAVSVAVLSLAVCGVVPGVLVTGGVVPIAVAVVLRSVGERRSPAGTAGIAALPFALDLGAAVLRSGAPVSAALEHAAPAAGEVAEALLHVARLLRLGAGPDEVWRSLSADARLTSLAAVSRRSAASGIRLAGAWEQLAGELRAERRSEALARANRAGVFAMAPLGLCFLPAFICLGVVPDVIGIARGVLSTAT